MSLGLQPLPNKIPHTSHQDHNIKDAVYLFEKSTNNGTFFAYIQDLVVLPFYQRIGKVISRNDLFKRLSAHFQGFKRILMALALKSIKAFSLLELLFVILILGILIGLGMPSFIDAIDNNRLKGSARNLFSVFKKARLEAIRRNTNVAISIIPAGYSPDGMVGSYQVFVDDGAGNGTAGNFILDGDEEILVTANMPAKVSLISSTFTGTPKSTAFNSRGLPIKLGDVRIRNSKRWYRISLGIAGNVNMTVSTDGTW